MDEVSVGLKITLTSRQDAAHLGLTEDDLAEIGAALIRDPTRGRFSKNHTYRFDWRHVTVKYVLRFKENDEIVVYILRIQERRNAPRNLNEAKSFARDLSLGVIRKKIEGLLDSGV